MHDQPRVIDPRIGFLIAACALALSVVALGLALCR
jgi:hypothetical protein